MHDIINTFKSPGQPAAVAYITEKITDWILTFRKYLRHLVLFEFIAAEDDKLLGFIPLKDHFGKFITERTGPARHQNCFTI